jgi:hypothetical protein
MASSAGLKRGLLSCRTLTLTLTLTPDYAWGQLQDIWLSSSATYTACPVVTPTRERPAGRAAAAPQWRATSSRHPRAQVLQLRQQRALLHVRPARDEAPPQRQRADMGRWPRRGELPLPLKPAHSSSCVKPASKAPFPPACHSTALTSVPVTCGPRQVGVASAAFHSSSGAWREWGRRLDFWTIAATSNLMTRAM